VKKAVKNFLRGGTLVVPVSFEKFFAGVPIDAKPRILELLR
jgi:hypothetical protein